MFKRLVLDFFSKIQHSIIIKKSDYSYAKSVINTGKKNSSVWFTIDSIWLFFLTFPVEGECGEKDRKNSKAVIKTGQKSSSRSNYYYFSYMDFNSDSSLCRYYPAAQRKKKA